VRTELHEPIPPGIVRAADGVSVDLALLFERLSRKGYPVPSMVAFMQRTTGLLTDEIPNAHAFTHAVGEPPRGAPVATAQYLEHVHALGPACPAYERIDWDKHRRFRVDPDAL
jgi:hypothetical protein